VNVLIHGAVNGDNFGDCLFANIFYNYLKSCRDISPYFWRNKKFGISNFLSQELDYDHTANSVKLKNMDALVYMSGGYFGEREKGIRHTIRRFLRYVKIGLLFAVRKKPIFIVGVGVGPIYSKFLRYFVGYIFKRSNLIIVRDSKSKNYIQKYNFKCKPIVSADTALALHKSYGDDNSMNSSIFHGIKNKTIFLHVDSTYEVQKFYCQNIIPEVEKIVKTFNYDLILGYDGGSDKDVKQSTIWNYITVNKIAFDYQSTRQLVNLLKNVNLIITPKLHVGIVGALFSKSVISFPLHPEKTKRFYYQINASDRCIPLYETSRSSVKTVLNYFHNKPLHLPQNIINKAEKNMCLLSNALSEIINEEESETYN